MTTKLLSPTDAAAWLQERVSGGLTTDSRQVRPGDGFIAWPGAAADGRRFVADALTAGALACLVEAQDSSPFEFTDPRLAFYSGLKTAAAPIAAAYYEQPSRQLQTVAITGTNGKTSTAWWLAHAFERLGRKCGVIGTLGIGVPSAMVFTGLTTPDPVLLQRELRRFVGEGFSACAIEASSIGIAEHRLDAVNIQVAVFTNFSQDHLDYHPSMAHYWAAKESLFSWPGLASAVINIDDGKGAELVARLEKAGLPVWSVSCAQPARIQVCSVDQSADVMTVEFVEGQERHRVELATIGLFNVSNILCVVGSLRALGVPLQDAVNACVGLPPVPGRLNTLALDGGPLVVIDYAHTPDALEKVLTALKPVAAKRAGQLWCVFGCGGDRDSAKRPLMGSAAQKHADQVVVTSDNPRSENPDAIIEQISAGLTGAKSFHAQPDRAKAIAEAVRQAGAKDVILIAGKGHEDYQEFDCVKVPFSDQSHAQAALQLRATRLAAS